MTVFAFLLRKKLTYIIIKFYSLGVIAMYSPEGLKICRTGTAGCYMDMDQRRDDAGWRGTLSVQKAKGLVRSADMHACLPCPALPCSSIGYIYTSN